MCPAIQIIGRKKIKIPHAFAAIKDPCPVRQGKVINLFGTSLLKKGHGVFRTLSQSLDGPWSPAKPVRLPEVHSENACAPGVIFDGRLFHMFLQTEFSRPGGVILYLTSEDGWTFSTHGTALGPEGLSEAGVYDPHPFEANGGKYFCYTGFPESNKVQGDIYLAVSESSEWHGPWRRLHKILDHDDVPFHNTRTDPDYEWGLEGAQVQPLGLEQFWMSAVCFLPTKTQGNRQRVFFAESKSPAGPYRVTGTLEPQEGCGETGHAAGYVESNVINLFYQSRDSDAWGYEMAQIIPSPPP